MIAQKLLGQPVAGKILQELKAAIEADKLQLTLGIILVGDNAESLNYIREKKKAGEQIGVQVKIFEFSANISVTQLRKEVTRIAKRKDIDGLIVQLHLPGKLRDHEQRILNAIPLHKDVDVLSEHAVGKLVSGASLITPPTIAGILKLFVAYGIDIKGKHIVIIGDGKLVGRPAREMLARIQNIGPVTQIAWLAEQYPSYIASADIIISGANTRNVIKPEMVKEGAVVIDSARDLSAEAAKKTSFYTPYIGGIGPMTVAMLFANLVALNRTK